MSFESYNKSSNMRDNSDLDTFCVYKSVLNFLPGGVAQTSGKAFSYWDDIKNFANNTDVTADRERSIKKTVGFNRSEMSSIEHKWSIEIGAR